MFFLLLKENIYILRGQTKHKENYFLFVTGFYICTLIVDIIIRNNDLRIICNNFQEILSMSKEMTFTETNKGYKSTFAYE